MFVDVDNIMGGDDWLRTITRAVAVSKALVPIVSTTYGDADKSKYTYEVSTLVMRLIGRGSSEPRKTSADEAGCTIVCTLHGKARAQEWPCMHVHTQEYKLAHNRQKVIVPVYHSGDFPPLDLSLIMGSTMQYVPAAGAMTGPRKSSVQEVRELYVGH